MAKPATFGDRLHEFRKRVPLTQRQLADAIQVDFTYISKIESGAAPPPSRDRIDLAAKTLRLTSSETEELFRLAEKIPANVAEFVARRPATQRLLRSIRQLPPAEQDKLLDQLIRQAEAYNKKSH